MEQAGGVFRWRPQQAGAGGRNCEERGARGAGQGRAPAERPSVIPD